MTAAVRQSPLQAALHHRHPQQGIPVHGMPAVRHFGDPDGEVVQAADLAVCDVSGFPRIGIRGSGCLAWVRDQGISVPDEVYGFVDSAELDSLIVRTGSAELLIEDGLTGSLTQRFGSLDPGGVPGVYSYFRQDAGILLSGARANDVLRETCGYNFRNPEADMVFTRVAGVSCGILKRDRPGLPVFHLWCDGTFGEYLWEQLEEIARDHGGRAVGLAPFFPLTVQR